MRETAIVQGDFAARQAYLRSTAAKVKASFNVDATFHEVEGDVPTMLGREAFDEHVDLVVMATHGRGPIGRFFFGSVADALVRNLPAPILLWRAESRDGWPILTGEIPL